MGDPSAVAVDVFQAMPRQDLVESSGHELGIFGRDGAVLDHVRHTSEGLPKVAAINGSNQECRDCSVQLV
ncbi:hypothetical protein JH298_21550 (plasmid) [Xanthomonas campestris pv. campestris]|uniref:hypothetical protein n=1 Tax=Xanthomonas campestris TaxID=339 RepID=UPI0027A7134A|nr:hypothetical protein JH298_21550 [Xanthomonas campestris pv. campestris]